MNITAKPTDHYTYSGNNVSAHNGGRYIVRLNSTGAAALDAAHFNPTQSYRWEIVRANAIQVNGAAVSAENQLDPNVFSVDTADFKIEGSFANANGGLNTLYGGKFQIELGNDGKSLFLNYISPVKADRAVEVKTAAGKELLWNISDFDQNGLQQSQGAGRQNYGVQNNSYFTEQEIFGNDEFEKIDFTAPQIRFQKVNLLPFVSAPWQQPVTPLL